MPKNSNPSSETSHLTHTRCKIVSIREWFDDRPTQSLELGQVAACSLCFIASRGQEMILPSDIGTSCVITSYLRLRKPV